MELNLKEETLFCLHILGNGPLQILVALTNVGFVFPLGRVKLSNNVPIVYAICSGPLCMVHAYLNILCHNWVLLTDNESLVWFNALQQLRELSRWLGGSMWPPLNISCHSSLCGNRFHLTQDWLVMWMGWSRSLGLEMSYPVGLRRENQIKTCWTESIEDGARERKGSLIPCNEQMPIAQIKSFPIDSSFLNRLILNVEFRHYLG